MGCFKPRSSKTSTMKTPYSEPTLQQNPEPINLTQELLFQVPACIVHLMIGGEAIELSKGPFTLVRILEDHVSLATIVKVGVDLQWPLTKDEPVVKADSLHYLFSLPMKDGDPLSYGVTFFEQDVNNLVYLDSFLSEHSCFSCSVSSSNGGTGNNVDWREYAPRVEAYNNVLAKAIAGGTGQIVRGIFKCSNAYTNQVQKGGEIIVNKAAMEKNGALATQMRSNRNVDGATNKSKVNKGLKRVRKLSKMTEKLSKAMLDGVGTVTGSVMRPVVKSQAGKAFLAMAPGEVVLASLDAVNKILDAAEIAEKQALSATSKAATRMVANRFGESAGEATEHAFATAGHCASTAWNIFKIRKAINPASSVTNGVLRNAPKNRNYKS